MRVRDNKVEGAKHVLIGLALSLPVLIPVVDTGPTLICAGFSIAAYTVAFRYLQ